MNALDDRAYDGWIVVEQDVLNGSDVPLESFLAARAADQRQNRQALRRWT
jgi:inosose dehydratase